MDNRTQDRLARVSNCKKGFLRKSIATVLAQASCLILGHEAAVAASWDSGFAGFPSTGINAAITTDGSVVYASTTEGGSTDIYKWQSGSWTLLPYSHVPGLVKTLKVISGYLYVGGNFASVGDGGPPTSAANIAKYNLANNTWSQVAEGLNGQVNVIESAWRWDSSKGDYINWVYVGGLFTSTANGSQTLNNLARAQHGRLFQPSLNGGVHAVSFDGPASGVTSIVVTTNGPGGTYNSLIVGGCFDTAGTLTAYNIATWSDSGAGSHWSVPGNGLSEIRWCESPNDPGCVLGCEYAVWGFFLDSGPYVWRLGTAGTNTFISGFFSKVDNTSTLCNNPPNSCGGFHAPINVARLAGSTLTALPTLWPLSHAPMAVRPLAGGDSEAYIGNFDDPLGTTCTGSGTMTGNLVKYSNSAGAWSVVSGAPTGNYFDMTYGNPGGSSGVLMVGDFGVACYRP